MLSAIDTNVISALWSRKPTANRVAAWLNAARAAGGLVISPPVYAELRAHPQANDAFVKHFLLDTGIRIDFELGEEVWLRAAEAFATYADRRRKSAGKEPKRLLVDFVVGAHALKKADRLATMDSDRYRVAFPELVLEPL